MGMQHIDNLVLVFSSPTPVRPKRTMSPLYVLTLLLFPLASLSITLKNATTVTYIPPDSSNGTTGVEFTSSMFNFDSPRVNYFNISSWDWWYFDALDLNSNASVVIVLFAAPSAAFPWKTPTNLTSVSLEVTAPSGTILLAAQMDANGATMTTERGKDGASGDWEGTGVSFRSEEGMNRYIVSVDSPELGIAGEMILNTVSTLPTLYSEDIVPTTGTGSTITLPLHLQHRQRRHANHPDHRLGQRHSRQQCVRAFHHPRRVYKLRAGRRLLRRDRLPRQELG